MTLSFYRAAEFGDGEHIDYAFPLFPRRGLKALFPSIEGRVEHYCAFALPEHGSITFCCNLDNSIRKQRMENYEEFMAMLDTSAIRVKAYYPILHMLRSFGSSFAFKDTDLATCASVRKVFESFLFMSERIDWWGEHGVIRLPGGDGQHTDKINDAMFRKEISCLRIEASFVLNVSEEFTSKKVMASMDSLLGRDLNVLFGHGRGKESILTSSLEFVLVSDWLEQVRRVREMLLTTRVKDGGEINLLLKPGWRVITSRAKQQAECLQSLLGYCCQRTSQSVRSRLWGLVWNANAEKEYPGMCISVCVCVEFC